MEDLPHPNAAPESCAPCPAPAGVSLRAVIMALLGALAVMQVGVWAFLGLSLWWWALGGGALGIALIVVARAPGWGAMLSWRDLALCGAVSVLLLALGGEGRQFYANTDWQVRLAVLRDLVVQPWPFAYDVPGGPSVLRAPLGMYLAPALVGKAAGGLYAAELALWAQNSLLLTLVLGAGSALFDGARARAVALGVFLGFSGMDVVGQAIASQPLWLHLEQWAGFQFTAAVTQLFWVPQHCLTGWIFAVAYLGWRRGWVPRVALAVMLPLLPLLSPLAAVGCAPFALHAYGAGWRGFGARDWWRDLGWPVLAGVAALPGLLYLVVAGDTVGGASAPLPMSSYPTFILLEIGGYLLALRLRRGAGDYGAAVAWIVVGSLLVIPFGRVGAGMDFAMRASIPALAILAVLVAEVVVRGAQDADWRAARRVALTVFCIGLVTPVGEIGRAIIWPPAPAVTCGYYGVVPGGLATYVAPLNRFPAVIAPALAPRIAPHDPAHCWNGRWPDAVDGRDVQAHPGRG
ncbi:hypothetical protein GTZ99_01595 [Novosphingobium sp. FSY-8]|uniref:Uncharacterized protein n=1 Tax=Novosphingobium ovatum TaxID=1908523 RepID=A0ABW9X9Q5_9SPHN|nr:hypothetical protein [Novosphingobium ovatum]NBC35248.1 hypothetical protein [Novosphingobium ovatum]